jgi:hypothetical protein
MLSSRSVLAKWSLGKGVHSGTIGQMALFSVAGKRQQ